MHNSPPTYTIILNQLQSIIVLCRFPLPLNPFLGPTAFLRTQALLGKPPTVNTPLPLRLTFLGERPANPLCHFEPNRANGDTTLLNRASRVILWLSAQQTWIFGQKNPRNSPSRLSMLKILQHDLNVEHSLCVST